MAGLVNLDLGSLLQVGVNLIDELYTSEEEKAEAKIRLIKAQQEGKLDELNKAYQLNLAQIKANEMEAKSGRGGWRHQAGILCIAALAYTWLIQPLFVWLSTGMGIDPPPQIDATLAWSMLSGMLGLAGVRAFDLGKGSRV